MPYEVELPGVHLDAGTLTTPPTRLIAINKFPYNDEYEVPKTTNISFDLVDTGGTDLDVLSIVVQINGVVVYDGNLGFSPGYTGSAVDIDIDTRRVTINPSTDFDSEEVVEVEVDADIVGGGAAYNTSWTFTVEDLTSPSIVSATALGLKQVRLIFSEDVASVDSAADNDALNPEHYELARQSAPAVDTIVIRVEKINGSTFDLYTEIELTPRAEYLLVATLIEDLFGNIILPPGNEVTFTAYDPQKPSGRDFDLIKRLPEINTQGEHNAELRSFIGCLNEVNEILLAELDLFYTTFDIDTAEEKWLDLMLLDFGNPFILSKELDSAGKRRLLRVLFTIYKLKGTSKGVIDVIRFFLGLETEIYLYNGVSLGLGEMYLDIDFYLNPSGQSLLYSFDVVVDGPFTSQNEKDIRDIVELMKPAHTHLILVRN